MSVPTESRVMMLYFTMFKVLVHEKERKKILSRWQPTHMHTHAEQNENVQTFS